MSRGGSLLQDLVAARRDKIRAERPISVYNRVGSLAPVHRLLASAAADRLVADLHTRYGDQALAELERACAAARRAGKPVAKPPVEKPRSAVGEPLKKAAKP